MAKQQNKYIILINLQSGLVKKLSRDGVRENIQSSPVQVEEIHFFEPGELSNVMKKYATSAHPILIGGGDGTFLSAADIFMKHNKPFGLLPMGTMNLLALDLGLPVKIDALLEKYAAKTTHIRIDVGTVNNRNFLCCATLGTIPESALFREDNRNQITPILIPRLTVFTLNQMDQLKQKKLRLNIDEKQKNIRTSALIISNNKYGPKEEWAENSFKRKTLNDGILGIYSLEPLTLWDRIRILLKLKIGGWSNDRSIYENSAHAITCRTKEKSHMVSLDGEVVEMQTPLNFSMRPKALSIITPQHLIDTERTT